MAGLAYSSITALSLPFFLTRRVLPTSYYLGSLTRLTPGQIWENMVWQSLSRLHRITTEALLCTP